MMHICVAGFMLMVYLEFTLNPNNLLACLHRQPWRRLLKTARLPRVCCRQSGKAPLCCPKLEKLLSRSVTRVGNPPPPLLLSPPCCRLTTHQHQVRVQNQCKVRYMIQLLATILVMGALLSRHSRADRRPVHPALCSTGWHEHEMQYSRVYYMLPSLYHASFSQDFEYVV